MNNLKLYILEHFENSKFSITEKLKINKETGKDKSIYDNLNLDNFKELIKDTLNYTLDNDDLKYIKDYYVPKSKDISDVKFKDITNDDEEWYKYKEITTHDKNVFEQYYVIKNLKKGYLFHYINTSKQEYRIGYILDHMKNIKNRNMIKIFKIYFE